MGSNRATVHDRRWQDLSRSRPAGGQARRDGDTAVGLVREDHGDTARDCRVGQATMRVRRASVIVGSRNSRQVRSGQEAAMRRPGFLILLLFATFASACMTGARVISGFGDLRSADGVFRSDGPHNGIDIAAMPGGPYAFYVVSRVSDGDLRPVMPDFSEMS